MTNNAKTAPRLRGGFFKFRNSVAGALGLLLRHVGESVLAGQVDAALLIDLGDLDEDLVADGDDVRVERPDGYAAVHELRIESWQIAEASHRE